MNVIREEIRPVVEQRFAALAGCDQQTLRNTDLRAQSDAYRDTGGCSEGNAGLGFLPAFLDAHTGIVYRSRFRDGTPAPLHLLDGLRDDVIVSRAESGRVTAAKASLVSGFVRCARFYTRAEAAIAVDQALPRPTRTSDSHRKRTGSKSGNLPVYTGSPTRIDDRPHSRS